MLNTKEISKNSDFFADAMKKRGEKYFKIFQEFITVQEKWKTLKQKIDGQKHKQKIKGKGMRGLKGDDAVQLRQELKDLSMEISRKSGELKKLESKRDLLLLNLPNLPHQDIPIGGENNNKIIQKTGTIKDFGFKPLPHWEIGTNLDILDFETATAMSGARFSILKGAGAKLERALIQFMLDEQSSRGYTEVSPPLLVKRDAMVGTGQVPHLEEDTFKTQNENDPYYLIPTAEVVLVNMQKNKILNSAELPCNYVACTSCFRSEAGSYGRDVRGLIRQHQFYKVELVKIVKAADSEKQLIKLRKDAENILEKLELPYQVVLLSSEDMGFAATKTYDLEVWIPSENTYREISSCSNCTDFQARRALIRHRENDNEKPVLCHTLNGSGLAVGRTLLAILENYQNKDGSVSIPVALRPYLDQTAKIDENGLS
ncbi:MAG: serine--tRNA ligase [Myxococcota bacterium]